MTFKVKYSGGKVISHFDQGEDFSEGVRKKKIKNKKDTLRIDSWNVRN